MLGVISTFIMSGKLRSQVVLTEQSSAAFKYRSDALSGNSFSHILRKNFEIPYLSLVYIINKDNCYLDFTS